MFFSFGNKFLNVIEIKKGFARGGHYHKYQQDQIILFGKVEYREENIFEKKEKITIIDKPSRMIIPPLTAHLLIAIEDTCFVETFTEKYEATYYPKYRKIINKKMTI